MEITFKTASNSDRNLLLSLIEEFYQLEHLTYNVEVLNKKQVLLNINAI